MNTAADVSIVFVNWNSAPYLISAITSIYKHTQNLDFEIIVVDNASPSQDADLVKETFPEIQLIRSAANLGFGRANNLGFRTATGQYILFLNPDTRLISPAINVMLEELKSVARAGAIGCKLLNSDLSVQTSCIQTFPTILNQVLDADSLRNRWPKSRLWGTAPLYFDTEDAAEVEVISGACLMVKRHVFEEISQFTERYFMYAEDLDLCRKIVRAGYKNLYTGQAKVIHYGGGSSIPESAT
ncbi:MAG: glycosyltransferase family 2 protein, partial [Terriglobia bacterium]